MKIERYLGCYEQILGSWLLERGLDTGVLADLPEVGFVVEDGFDLVAAGFLRRCEGNYALIDSVVTNPHMTPELRDKALDLLTKKLMDSAEYLGVKQVLAFTVDNNTQCRAVERHGMTATPYVVLIKALPFRKVG